MKVDWSSFHRLTRANVLDNAPASAGVYTLWVQLQNEKWRCYYVGQASNIEQRLLDHISDDEPNSGIRANVNKYISGFESANVGKQTDRDGIEKYLYNYYKPECNEVDPGGTPIEINLS